MFKVTILNPKRVLFEDHAKSVFLCGDTGEFEILAYHNPLISLLKEGDIIIDFDKRLPIKGGIVKFYANELVAMVDG